MGHITMAMILSPHFLTLTCNETSPKWLLLLWPENSDAGQVFNCTFAQNIYDDNNTRKSYTSSGWSPQDSSSKRSGRPAKMLLSVLMEDAEVESREELLACWLIKMCGTSDTACLKYDDIQMIMIYESVTEPNSSLVIFCPDI